MLNKVDIGWKSTKWTKLIYGPRFGYQRDTSCSVQVRFHPDRDAIGPIPSLTPAVTSVLCAMKKQYRLFLRRNIAQFPVTANICSWRSNSTDVKKPSSNTNYFCITCFGIQMNQAIRIWTSPRILKLKFHYLYTN